MRKIHLLIGFVIVLLSLYYVFKNVSIDELRNAFVSVHYIYLIPSTLLVAMSFLLRGIRWKYLVSSVKKVKTANLFSPLMVGFMGNFLPARAGEFIRAYLLSKRENISFSASFATIFLERLFDIGMLLIIIVYVLLFETASLTGGEAGANHQLVGYMIKVGWVSFIGFITIFLFSLLLQYKNDWAMKIVNLFIKPLPHKYREKIVGLVYSFTQGLSILKNIKGFIKTILLSFAVWVVAIASYYPLYQAFDIETALPVISSLLILSLTINVFITLFPTPAFLGASQAASVVALHEIFKVPKAVALSFGIVAWIVSMGFVAAAGMFFIMKDNISIGVLSAKNEQIN